ncbi:hypothetical protein ADT71_02140 [Novosphingobium sp. ST904]|nr:hypothetical protein ADT71_02140 [Novosphingobium sp. ST904]TCM30022.1 hypothetical protein EDF59_12748 [Novosphingobium sp. ST904]
MPMDSNNLWVLRIHEHVCTSEKCLFTKIIKLVRTKRRHQNLCFRQAIQVSIFNLLLVVKNNFSNNDIHGGMIVTDKDVSIVHGAGIHVRVIA